jgi:ABC-type branched-subunit amino acid transport system permease subunit
MRKVLTWRTPWLFMLGIALALVLPRVFTTRYALSVLVLTGMFIIFALSYDLSVGHVGTVHLAAPAFFGLGAYVTGLIGVRLGLPFLANLVLSAVVMALFALVVGVPSFRLSHVTFAIGTLAFATVSQQVVNSAVDLTRGPLCVQGIPRPEIVIPGLFQFRATSTLDYYHLLLPFVFFTIFIYLLLTRSRIGRAFAAVRDDEILASAAGVHPLRYKMLAFIIGAALAGALGSFQAHYLTVICPTELTADYTTRLLIILFVGGAGSLTGLLLGSIIFTILPELMRGLGNLEITPAHQLIIFGFILLFVIKYAPGGLQEIWMRGKRSWLSRRGAPPADQEVVG